MFLLCASVQRFEQCGIHPHRHYCPGPGSDGGSAAFAQLFGVVTTAAELVDVLVGSAATLMITAVTVSLRRWCGCVVCRVLIATFVAGLPWLRAWLRA